MRSSTRILGIGALASLCLACGSDEAPLAPESAAVPETQESTEVTTAAPSGGRDFADDELQIESGERQVRLDPARPTPGKMVRAIIDHAGASPRGYRFVYTWTISGQPVESSSAAIQLPELQKGVEVKVTVVATDDSGDSQTLIATANIRNTPPRVRDLRIVPDTDSSGGEIWRAEASGDDPDGDPLVYRYEWIVNGETSDVDGPAFPTRELKRGDKVRLRVTANDGEEDSRPAESGTVGVANAAPDILSRPPMLGSNGKFVYQIEAEDPDGDSELSFILVSGPEGMELDASSGILSWTPTTEQAGDNPVELAVEDEGGSRTTQSFTIPIVLGTASAGTSPAAIDEDR